MKSSVKALFLLLLIFVSQLIAAVPQQINYQGFLTNPSGTPLDTTVGITFKLYTDSTAGTLLWTEARASVSVVKGLFNVKLGQGTALTDAIVNQSQLWLGTTVGADPEMTPRTRIVSAGYSYRVGTVDGATGGTISGQINVGSGNTNAGSFANVHGENNLASGDHAVVGGGMYNRALGEYSVVAGGGGPLSADSNCAQGDYSVIGGGLRNYVRGDSSTIAGGFNNQITGIAAYGDGSTIGGGAMNGIVSNYSTIGGGLANYMDMLVATYATIGGGQSNRARGIGSIVPGGSNNYAYGDYSFAAGQRAKALHNGSFVWSDHQPFDFSSSTSSEFNVRASGGVRIFTNSSLTEGVLLPPGASCWQPVNPEAVCLGGGQGVTLLEVQSDGYLMGSNSVSNTQFAFAGGGSNNNARGSYSTIGGGGGAVASDSNSAIGTNSTIGGGLRNQASAPRSTVSGGVANKATNDYATISGGDNNTASGNSAFVGGGTLNKARGQNSVVAGGGSAVAADSNSASGDYSAIGGGTRNLATNEGAMVGGGYGNISSGIYTAVAGGSGNTASNDYSAVAGGALNIASGVASVVCGGRNNFALGQYAVVSGGGGTTAPEANSASGDASMIPGGRSNRVTGSYSLAAGYRARANHTGAFVWGASTSGTDSTASFADYSFTARCANGARFYTAASGVGSGVLLAAGGGSWANLCDANQKRFHGEVNTSEVLNKISTLPLHKWSYKTQDESIQHIGPTAQDFYAAFGLGDENTTITSVDPDGISLAAIQELAKENQELKQRLSKLESIIEQMANEKNGVKKASWQRN